MTAIKTSKGWQIKLESGKLLPKIYPSKEAADKRIAQLIQFRDKESMSWYIDDFKLEEASKWLNITGVALTAGKSSNGRTYNYDNMEQNDGLSFNVIAGHRDDYDNPDHVVGDGKYRLDGDKLMFDARVKNTTIHPDMIDNVNDGLLAPSIQGKFGATKEMIDGEEVINVTNLKIPLLAMVTKHVRGVHGSSIETAIAERLELSEVETFEPPQSGDAPQAVKDILDKTYTAARKKYDDKSKCAKIAWGAVKKVWEKDEDGKWKKIKEESNMADEELSKKLKEAEEKLEEVESAKVEAEKKVEDFEKEAEDAKAEEEKKEEEEKSKVVESILTLNKELKKEELAKKTLNELKTIKEYEGKLSTVEGASEVVDEETETKDDELKGIVVEKDTRFVSMTEERRQKFNDDLMESIYS